jgi:hypothetical protein
LFDLLDDDADDDAVDTLAIRVNSSGVGGLSHSQSQGTFRSAIHQFMPENMPKIMPAVLSMKKKRSWHRQVSKNMPGFMPGFNESCPRSLLDGSSH